MTQCITLSVKLFNSQLNELKLVIETGTEPTLKIQTNVFGDSSDENNSPYK